MTGSAFETLLDEAYRAHSRIADLADFCAFPDDLKARDLSPRWIPPADLMLQDAEVTSVDADPLAKAFVAAAPEAYWRLTYEGTGIGQDFLDRFGCYCLIGPGGGWISEKMAAFVVYMPPNLHYPWHHHPAEELYYVLAGEAEFFREGEGSEVISAGQSSFHATNQAHATQTQDRGLLAYVLWRSELDTPPVLTERAVSI